MSTEEPEEPKREPAPTVVRPRREPPETVVLPDDDGFTVDEVDLRTVVTSGCALQIAAGFTFVGMVGWTLVAVVFGRSVAESSPGFGHAVLVAEASLALGCMIGAYQIVRHLRAVADGLRRRSEAVPRALAAHRDFVATATVSAAITVVSLVVGTLWWLTVA